MARTKSDFQEMARIALIAKSEGDPRYELLVIQLCLKCDLSRQQVEDKIVRMSLWA